MDRRLKFHFPEERGVATVVEAGWAGEKNGELLRLAEKEFDAFVTTGKGILHQQNVSSFNLALILLRAKSYAYEDLEPLMNDVNATLGAVETSTVHTVFARKPS